MRTEDQITADITAKREAYHAVAATETTDQLAARTAEIRALLTELSAMFTEGAGPCPRCGVMPFGMRKSPGEIEIGCLGCPPEMLLIEGQRVRKDARVRAPTVAEAVRLWNEGQRLTFGVVEEPANV